MADAPGEPARPGQPAGSRTRDARRRPRPGARVGPSPTGRTAVRACAAAHGRLTRRPASPTLCHLSPPSEVPRDAQDHALSLVRRSGGGGCSLLRLTVGGGTGVILGIARELRWGGAEVAQGRRGWPARRASMGSGCKAAERAARSGWANSGSGPRSPPRIASAASSWLTSPGGLPWSACPYASPIPSMSAFSRRVFGAPKGSGVVPVVPGSSSMVWSTFTGPLGVSRMVRSVT